MMVYRILFYWSISWLYISNYILFELLLLKIVIMSDGNVRGGKQDSRYTAKKKKRKLHLKISIKREIYSECLYILICNLTIWLRYMKSFIIHSIRAIIFQYTYIHSILLGTIDQPHSSCIYNSIYNNNL